MGLPIPTESPIKINLSHQEVARIIEELEKAYTTTTVEWIPAAPIADLLSRELGYEDEEEFNDALGGTFVELLNTLPNVQTQTGENGEVRFKVVPEPPEEEWKARKLTLRITDRTQLWNVLLKSPYATIEIPELEFAIQRNGMKKIDSLYNHIGNAIFELGTHVRTVPMSDDHQNKIVDCITSLNDLLDVPAPWTCIVEDPSGISEFSDMTGVEIA
ncbi:uncharacterized protein SPPG_02136 [Spizellomyces punctatus DAOM BR117]|uniref:Zinc finger ZPR1-type domain-containing protein n=1 Tax=Spizellomyces punctatus (strain DAOM BR117) TaxID=645134 RepID=A0A0L0HNU7_SPIPD|nr:uncharacterized protein SPPG_02136 [Spizellomyces punctatus DAOM BR117]KND03071.1 hypothetical protein SPPG_02136 [Spizellomyces punctatus DAOM BR117]|eukprot:XP_016611110.1 hypothetical protein SPPG_02136 [Spizellomyces punctatus DAOM BR117]